MEINRTSIDVDAAALQRIETRSMYASFVQYWFVLVMHLRTRLYGPTDD